MEYIFYLKKLGLCLIIFSSLSCKNPPKCLPIEGKWSNREGQTFTFLPNGQAIWLFSFGSITDTFPINFRYDCSTQPAQIDIFGFSQGAMVGKTLYGILEWTNDSSFRFDATLGNDASLRPTTFDQENAKTFVAISPE